MWSSLLLSLCLVACDSGDIAEKSYATNSRGRAVKLTATVTGMDTWDNNYSVALAGFRDESNYAVMQYPLPAQTADGTAVELVLGNLTGQVSTVEFAITNRLRERIVTLERVVLADYPESQDTIRMDVGPIDVSLLGSIQHGVFDKACIQCHGGNGRSAAGLDLTAGHARDNLADVPSTRKEGMFRVVSGDAPASLLHQILAEGGEDILGYNHTEVVSSQFKENQAEVRSLIDEWINKLKVED